jgi:hypothetical protein
LKKITAIFFLLLFSFNWFGYRLYFDYLLQKTDKDLEVLFDNNLYNDAQLIEFKIPLHLPYQTSWTSYQRYDGEITLNGTIYKYVKRKLSNDTLYLMCLPNSNKMRLETAKINFFKNSNDLAQNDNSNETSQSVSKNLQSVYDDSVFNFSLISLFTSIKIFRGTPNTKKLIHTPHSFPEQPPDLSVA